MTAPVDAVLEALKAANVPADSPTRLATVTGGDGYTLTVRFDGETTASSRPYQRLYAPAAVGDRVVMLRNGSTWVALARIATATTIPDTGWIAPFLQNGWVNYVTVGGGDWVGAAYRRINGIVHLDGLVANGSGVIFNLPAGFRPRSGNHMFGSVTGTNGGGRTDIHSNGNVTAAAGNNAFWTLAGISFPADL